MFKWLLDLTKFLQESGISSALIVCGIICFAILMVVFYRVIYIPHQEGHKANFQEVIKTIKEHILEESSVLKGFTDSITKVSDEIVKINLTLVKEHITRADVDKEQWALVKARLDETAEVVFCGAIMNACMDCSNTDCTYYQEFSKLIQIRRKESWHIWEESAVPVSVLTIIEQIDAKLYPIVIDRYIPDIVSICHDETYSKFPKEVRIELLRNKVEVYKEKVKRDWESEILRRVNIL